MAVQGHPTSKVVHLGTEWRRVCDFLLVTSSNLGPILHRFWDESTYWPKIANFPYRLSFSPSLGVNPFECLMSRLRPRTARPYWQMLAQNPRPNYRCNYILDIKLLNHVINTVLASLASFSHACLVRSNIRPICTARGVLCLCSSQQLQPLHCGYFWHEGT